MSSVISRWSGGPRPADSIRPCVTVGSEKSGRVSSARDADLFDAAPPPVNGDGPPGLVANVIEVINPEDGGGGVVGGGGGVVVEDGSLITFDPVALDLITLKRAS